MNDVYTKELQVSFLPRLLLVSRLH